MNRSHGNISLGEGPEVGALFGDPRGRRAADPVVGLATRIDAAHELIPVDAQPLSGDDDPAQFVVRQARNIDIQQAVRWQPVFDHQTSHAGGDPGRRAVVARLGLIFGEIERNGDPRHPADHRLHGRRDGPGVGDVVPEVGAIVDSGDAQINLLGNEAEHGQGHTIGRSPVGGVGRGPVRQLGRPGPQGLVQSLDMAAGGPVVIGCQNGHLAQGFEGMGQGGQPWRIDAIIIGDQDVCHARLIGAQPVRPPLAWAGRSRPGGPRPRP